MQLRPLIGVFRFAALLVVLGSLATTLPGCGGGGDAGGDGVVVEPVAPDNPAPGDAEPETGLQ